MDMRYPTPTLDLSIVIPVYNEEENIRETVMRTIHVVENSPYVDQYEILIVNDGSTDDVESVVALLKDERIVYLKNGINLGVNPTVNTGFRRATGDYMCVLAADDVLPAGSLHLRHEALVEGGFEVVHAGITVLDEGVKRYIPPLDTTQSANVVDFLRQGSKTVGINNATFMYDRRIFAKIGYRDEGRRYFPHNDYEFALRTLLGCKVGVVDAPVYVYERHEGSHHDVYATNAAAEQRSRDLRDKYLAAFEKKVVA